MTLQKVRPQLCASPETLQKHYQVTEPLCIPKKKTFDVKNYHKSHKNRSQVVYKKIDNCDKLNYSLKGKKRTFYKKF